MTAQEMVYKFGIQDGGMKEGVRAMKITHNAKAAVKIADQIRVAKEEILAIVDAAAARRQATEEVAAKKVVDRKTALENGAPFELSYSEGEILSGYTAYGPDADFLKGAGVAKDISGWGTYIEPSAIAALGTRFTLADLLAYLAPAHEAARAQESLVADQLEVAHRRAIASHQPVELVRWTVPCDGSVCECSVDVITRWILPSGDVREERTHTY